MTVCDCGVGGGGTQREGGSERGHRRVNGNGRNKIKSLSENIFKINKKVETVCF